MLARLSSSLIRSTKYRVLSSYTSDNTKNLKLNELDEEQYKQMMDEEVQKLIKDREWEKKKAYFRSLERAADY
jgi:hypothetical protein